MCVPVGQVRETGKETEQKATSCVEGGGEAPPLELPLSLCSSFLSLSLTAPFCLSPPVPTPLLVSPL